MQDMQGIEQWTLVD